MYPLSRLMAGPSQCWTWLASASWTYHLLFLPLADSQSVHVNSDFDWGHRSLIRCFLIPDTSSSSVSLTARLCRKRSHWGLIQTLKCALRHPSLLQAMSTLYLIEQFGEYPKEYGSFWWFIMGLPSYRFMVMLYQSRRFDVARLRTLRLTLCCWHGVLIFMSSFTSADSAHWYRARYDSCQIHCYFHLNAVIDVPSKLVPPW